MVFSDDDYSRFIEITKLKATAQINSNQFVLSAGFVFSTTDPDTREPSKAVHVIQSEGSIQVAPNFAIITHQVKRLALSTRAEAAGCWMQYSVIIAGEDLDPEVEARKYNGLQHHPDLKEVFAIQIEPLLASPRYIYAEIHRSRDKTWVGEFQELELGTQTHSMLPFELYGSTIEA